MLIYIYLSLSHIHSYELASQQYFIEKREMYLNNNYATISDQFKHKHFVDSRLIHRMHSNIMSKRTPY